MTKIKFVLLFFSALALACGGNGGKEDADADEGDLPVEADQDTPVEAQPDEIDLQDVPVDGVEDPDAREDTAVDTTEEEPAPPPCPPAEHVTVEYVLDHSDELDLQEIWVKGFFESSQFYGCTEMGCMDPICCNSCYASTTLQQNPFKHEQEINLDSTSGYLTLECSGNECYITCGELTRGMEYYVRGIYSAATTTLDVDLHCEVTGEAPSPEGTYRMTVNTVESSTCPEGTDPPLGATGELTMDLDEVSGIWTMQQSIWSLGRTDTTGLYEITFNATFTELTGNSTLICIDCSCSEAMTGQLPDPGSLVLTISSHIPLTSTVPCEFCDVVWQLWGERM